MTRVGFKGSNYFPRMNIWRILPNHHYDSVPSALYYCVSADLAAGRRVLIIRRRVKQGASSLMGLRVVAAEVLLL
jgi:hypothetical protein